MAKATRSRQPAPARRPAKPATPAQSRALVNAMAARRAARPKPAPAKPVAKVPARPAAKAAAPRPAAVPGSAAVFAHPELTRFDRRRLEHLASLGLSPQVNGKTVVDLGAGVGAHIDYYLDRGCTVTAVDARQLNLDDLVRRYPAGKYAVTPVRVDLDAADAADKLKAAKGPWQVVHAYSVLCHSANPAALIKLIGSACAATGIAVIETLVSPAAGEKVDIVPDTNRSVTGSVAGKLSLPTRGWVLAELRKHFAHVCMTRTQPNHEQFPTDWTTPGKHTRAVFVASRQPLDLPALVPALLDRQFGC